MSIKQIIHVDADQNLNFSNIAQFLPQFKITGRVEKADYSKKTLKITHLVSDTFQFISA